MSEFTEAELEAYLDETLDPDRASLIESQLTEGSDLLMRLSHINGRRDAGVHTLGEKEPRQLCSAADPFPALFPAQKPRPKPCRCQRNWVSFR